MSEQSLCLHHKDNCLCVFGIFGEAAASERIRYVFQLKRKKLFKTSSFSSLLTHFLDSSENTLKKIVHWSIKIFSVRDRKSVSCWEVLTFRAQNSSRSAIFNYIRKYFVNSCNSPAEIDLHKKKL